MTESPQFTAHELRMIADALTAHAHQIRKLHPKGVGTSELARIKAIAALSDKAVTLARQGERHGDVCSSGDSVQDVSDREDAREKL